MPQALTPSHHDDDRRNDSIHGLITARAAEAPDRIALALDEELTYGELDRRANQLANYLCKLGVRPDVPVGISMARSADLVIGILGVLKAGGYFIPIDAAYPAERRSFIQKDARAAIVLTQASLGLTHDAATVVRLDDDAPVIAQESPAAPRVELSPETAAYGIYTSGSTGRPKRVVVTHGSLVHYAFALRSALGLTREDRYLHTASFSFSASVRQLLVPLSLGACVVVARAEHLRDPRALLDFAKRRGATIFDTVPSYLQECAAARPPPDLVNGLRLVLTTGEPLPASVVKAWRATGYRGTMMNLYGQTETTGSVALSEIFPGDVAAGIIPIGRPIGQNALHVLDARMAPVVPGDVGELYVGGPSLARCYDGADAPPEDRFVTGPSAAGARLYRTGDYVRVRQDGALEFVGRADHRVKINGIRVDLGEIEAALEKAPGVRQAAVIAREDGDALRVIGYVLSEPEVALSPRDLRAHLKERLPAYLIPSFIVPLDRFPLTSSGKIDRRALPSLEALPPAAESALEAPRTPIEALIAGLLAAIMGLEEVDIQGDFFEMGGDSMQAVQLMTELQEALPVSLPLTALFFQMPTVAGLAEGIEAEAGPEGTRAILEHLKSATPPAGAARSPR